MHKIAIFLLWFGAVIDPIGDMFGVRYLALVAAFAGVVWIFLSSGLKCFDKSYRNVLILFIAGVFPVYGFTLYSFRAGSDVFIDTSYFASGILILTSLLYNQMSTCEFGVKSFVFSARLLSLLVLAGLVLQTFSKYEWISFFTERNVAFVSSREYSGITLPYIYFLASPLLIFLMAYDFCKYEQRSNALNLFIFALTAFSFAMTGTRAHILIAILFAPLYMLLNGNNIARIKAFFLFVALGIAAFSVDEIRGLILSYFSVSEASNSIKLALLEGYAEIFSNPLILLFGQGFNAHTWSLPLRDMVAMDVGASKTELTYLELVRVFGLIFAALFMATI
ncbi:MAG: hypothetical protein QMA97_01655 [Glaciecola sp.]